MKDGFLFRTSWDFAIRTLSLEDRGRLLLAVLDYAISGETPALSGAAQAVFETIAEAIRAERARDADISAKRAASGSKGGKHPKAKGCRGSNCLAGGSNCLQGGASNCKQLLADAPEGPRIKALDSVPAATGEEEDAEAPTDTYIDTTIDTNNTNNYRENRNDSKKRFVVPTAEEVAAYCRERGNKVDAQRFVDFYTSKGWQIGKEPMRDWRACVRTWERNGRDRVEVSGSTGATRPAKTVAAQQYSQRDYSDEDEEAFARMLAKARAEGF